MVCYEPPRILEAFLIPDPPPKATQRDIYGFTISFCISHAVRLEGYMSLVDHALAECEVCVWKVRQSFEEDLCGDCRLEESWIELIAAREKKKSSELLTNEVFICIRKRCILSKIL